MAEKNPLKVIFVAGFGPIVRDHIESLALYGGKLNLPLTQMPGDATYYHAESLEGVKHFALWPLTHAAVSCFGSEAWPKDVPEPQAWLEFEVEDIKGATAWLKQQGIRLLVETKKESWGQTVTRMISPEGILVAITETPWLRKTAI